MDSATIRVIIDESSQTQSGGGGGRGAGGGGGDYNEPPMPEGGDGEEDFWGGLFKKIGRMMQLPEDLMEHAHKFFKDKFAKKEQAPEEAAEEAPKNGAADSSATIRSSATKTAGEAAEAGQAAGAGEAGAAAGEAAAAGGEVAEAGALAALGPVGIAVGAVAVSLYLVGKAGDAAAKAIGTVADAMSSFARNDYFSVWDKSMHGAIDTMDKIPLLGPALTALPKVALASVEAVKMLTDTFIQRANDLAAFSGPISQAQANVEVKNIQADIKEANALGPGMARMIEAENDISLALRELLLPIKKVVVETLSRVLQFLADILSALATAKKETIDWGERLTLLFTTTVSAGIAEVTGTNYVVRKIFELLKSDDEGEQVKDGVLSRFDLTPFQRRDNWQPPQPRPQDPFNIPALSKFMP